MSAFFGALSVYMVFKISSEITGDKKASWAGAALLGLLPVFFTESIKAEVYTINTFLCMLIFYLGLKALKGADFNKNTLLSIFLLGLGSGNHHTIGLMGVILLIPIILRWRDITWKWLISAPLTLLIGFSVNIYIYMRSLNHLYKGSLIVYSFADSWDSFWRVLLRKHYESGSTISALTGSAHLGSEWLWGFKNGLIYILIPAIKYLFPFFILGFIFIKKGKKTLLYISTSVILWFGVLSRLSLGGQNIKPDIIPTINPYFLPLFAIVFILISLGFAYIIKISKRPHLQVLPRAIPYVFMALPLVFLPFTIKKSSLSDNFMAQDYGRDLLNVLPIKSLLLNHADNPIFSAFYMRVVERLREDVIAINTTGDKDYFGLESSPHWKYSRLYPEFYGSRKSTVKEIDRDFALKGKLFANSAIRLTTAVSKHYTFMPYLLSVMLYPKDMPMPKEKIRKAYMDNFEKINYERVMESPYMPDLMSMELYGVYGVAAMVKGGYLKQEGNTLEGDALYKKAFFIGEPKLYLWPYINFLLREGMEKEAFYIINGVKKAEGYERFAVVLEQNAISVVNSMRKND